MGKVDDKKKQKADTLLKAAFDLFTEQGITKTSISEIVERAGVAKGTFYLYFKDKYDIKNKLISHKASQIFSNATAALKDCGDVTAEEKIVLFSDNIIDQLASNRTLLSFISKNLSWGVFKNVIASGNTDEVDFFDVYMQLLNSSQYKYKNPEILLFLIVELVGSTCHDSILYNEPAPISELKPYILDSIRSIVRSHILLSTPEETSLEESHYDVGIKASDS